MKNIKITALSFLLLAGSVMSCKDQLDIQNPNQPTPSTASSEAGIVALAQGSVYKNGLTSKKQICSPIGPEFELLGGCGSVD